jgi:hypothetical protein
MILIFLRSNPTRKVNRVTCYKTKLPSSDNLVCYLLFLTSFSLSNRYFYCYRGGRRATDLFRSGSGLHSHHCHLSGRVTTPFTQEVTKRCRLSWLTNSALVYEPKCGDRGGVTGSQSMSTAVHRSPNKLWRSNSILIYAFTF